MSKNKSYLTLDTVKIMQQKKPKAEATTYRDAEWENLKFVICISRYCFRLLCRDHSSCIFHVSCGVTNKLVGTYYIDKKCTINARMNVCIDDITFNSTHILYNSNYLARGNTSLWKKIWKFFSNIPWLLAAEFLFSPSPFECGTKQLLQFVKL